MKILNSITEGGINVEGRGYEEISKILNKLVGVVNYDDENSIVYKITNVRFKTSQKYIRNIVFRGRESGNSQKNWLNEILSLFKDYKNKVPLVKDEIDQLLYDTLIRKDESGKDISLFETDEFSPDSISEKLIVREGYDDFRLADRVMGVLLHLIGKFSTLKMITGTMFFKDGNLRFFAHSTRSLEAGAQLMGIGSFGNLVVGRGYSPFYDFWFKSLYSPWELNYDSEPEAMGKFLIPGMDVKLFAPYYKLPSETSKHHNFYETLSYRLLFDFNKWYASQSSDTIEVLSSDIKELSKLWTTLSLIYETKITLRYDELIDLGFRSKDIEMYKVMGKKHLFSKLFSEVKDESIRQALVSYFDARGGISVNLDFKSRMPASIPSIFKSLTLTKDDWALFKSDEAEIANSLFIRIKAIPSQIKRIAGSILRHQKEFINEIANFLRSLADKHGVIRIYGYRSYSTGYGNAGDLSVNPYLPDPCSQQELDPNMPGNDPITQTLNDRFFELDPSKYEEFDFHKFLGALIADHQLFIVRTEGMAKNEILFAFGFLQGAVLPQDVVIARSGAKPGERNLGLIFTNNPDYIDLCEKLDKIFSYHHNVMVGVHKFVEYNYWKQACIYGGVQEKI